MVSDALQDLVRSITNKTEYLSVNQNSLLYYVDSFLSMKQQNRETENIIKYISYEININNLPSIYKKPIKDLIERFEYSPLSFFSFTFSFKAGIFYNCSPKRPENNWKMFEWLRNRGYNQINALEMKWPFLTEEFKNNEYVRIYKYAQEELVKELGDVESLLNRFKEDTINLLNQLYKIEVKDFLIEID